MPSKRTTPSVGEPPAVPAPTPDPHADAVQSAQQVLAEAEQALATAQAAVAAAAETATPLALRHRDVLDLIRLGVLAHESQDVATPEQAYRAAKGTLDRARTAAHRAEQERDQAATALARAELTADAERRRQWADEQHPDLAVEVLRLQQEALQLQANKYAPTSVQAASDLRAIRRRISALDAQLDQLARQAPAATLEREP